MNKLNYLAQANAALCADGKSVKTAFGCMSFVNTNTLAGNTVAIGLGLGGGVAIILIALAAFQIMTSQGDPKRFQGGKDLMTSAVSGVVLIAMSGFVLRLLGIDVLGLFS